MPSRDFISMPAFDAFKGADHFYNVAFHELTKADKRAFFTACSNASKAADYLCGLALAEPHGNSGVRGAGDGQLLIGVGSRRRSAS